MKKLILFLLLAPIITLGQTILLEQDIINDSIPENVGPNLKHFSHTYINYGSIIGSTSNDMEIGKSYEFSSGLRYKYKVSGFYALGFNLSYNMQSFRIKNPNFISGIFYDKEKLVLNNFEIELYNRFNFGKRGNVIGKYIDIGAYGNYAFVTKHYLRINNEDDPLATSKFTEIINRKLEYTNSINYGITARVGWEWFALYGKYRFSDIINSTSLMGEMPRLTVGVELSILN